MANRKKAVSKSKTIRIPLTKSDLWDIVRIAIGILVLCILLGVSLNMINDQIIDKYDEVLNDDELKSKGAKDIGWFIMEFGYLLPLVLVCTVPLLACLGSKKDAQRKHLIKALVIAGSVVVMFAIVCPKQINDLVKQKEFCELLEQRAEDEEDFIYPDDQPSVKEATAELERAVRWTARSVLSLTVVGAYQGVRYKKLRDGEQDDEIPEDEICDDLPDVDWVPGKRESKNS